MKTVFFTGKGGVGKSTMASAAAWQLASTGKRVLAVSFDPAHNLGDIFGLKLTNKKKKFDKELYLMEVNLEKSSSKYIKDNISLLESIYSYLKPFNMERYFQVLKYSPGIEEYASLTALEELIRTEKYFDYIIIDTPPTGLTVRILALPLVTLSWIERLKKIRSSILEKRYTIHNINGKISEKGVKLAYKESDDMVMKKLSEIEKRFLTLRSFLEGNNNSIVVVFNPDYLSLRESQRLINDLKELHLPFRTAVNNKVEERYIKDAEDIEKRLLNEVPSVKRLRIMRIEPPPEKGYTINENLTGVLF
ncbi:MAG: ArsA family ATPase [Spirochaetales bacterium]|nr:ArsA family ATPase [Spirochaetales bacterium]